MELNEERMDAMRVYHPTEPYQGLPAENVFLVSDDTGLQQGMGCIIPVYQPEVFPERPLNLYLQIDAPSAYHYVLLGALLARAYQLRSQTPNLPCRLYTQVAVHDGKGLEFFQSNGFQLDDAEDLVRMAVPANTTRLPMGCEVGAIPLRDHYEQQAMLQRMNYYRVSAMDSEFLGQCMQQPHFLALGVYRNGELIAETLLSGEGSRVFIGGLYVKSTYRRMGIAKGLLTQALAYMRNEGVTQADGLVLRRSPTQCGLAHAMGAAFIRTTCYYPGINMR